MKIWYSEENDTIIAHLEGDIDHHSVKYFKSNIDNVIEEKKPKTMVLDLKGVPFTDSSGIAIVIGRYKLLKEYNGTLKIINASKQVRKVFSFSALEKMMIME